MKNMIVSDYDETLYKNVYGLKRNIQAIKKFQKDGNIFVLSTARPYHSIKEEIDKYNIPFDYLSCSDGTQIFSSSKYITSSPIEKEVIDKVLDVLPESLTPVFSYNIENNNVLEMYYKVDGTFKEEQVLKTLIENLKEYDNIDVFYEYIWDDKVIMIKRCDISKSTSASLIANIENISCNRVFTIGDGLNDVPMIKDFNGFAIRGAKEEVLNECLGIYKTVSDLIYNVSRNNVKVKTR